MSSLYPQILGRCNFCIDVKDYKKSKKFYTKLGFKKVEGDNNENWGVYQHSNFRIGLYQGYFKGSSINFRGADIRRINKATKKNNFEIIGDKTGEAIGNDGTGSLTIKDPDDKVMFFDTAKSELDLFDKANKTDNIPFLMQTTHEEAQLGTCVVCYVSVNFEESISFYQKLGFHVIEGKIEEEYVILTNSNLRLALFKGSQESNDQITFNFRGSDIHKITKFLKIKNFNLESQNIKESDGSISTSLFDPDSYFIYFKTHLNEKD